jgi:anti-anti-sigma factor
MVTFPAFDCDLERDGSRLTCRARGELDLLTAPRLWDRMRPEIGDPEVRELRLDLDEVEFVDSSGIHVFLNLRRLLEERGGRLVIMRPRKSVAMVLRMMGLDDVLTGTPDGQA